MDYEEQNMEKELKTCVIYVRLSDFGKDDDSLSPDVQRERAIKEAKRKGLILLEEPYIDLNKSGTNVNRQGLQEMLARCSKGDVDAVIVQDTSRLARNTGDYIAIKTMLNKENIVIVSVNQPTASKNDPYSAYIDEMIAASNALHPRVTSFKVKLVMTDKFNFGWLPGPAPLGYENTRNSTPTCQLDRKIITLDQDIAPLIKLAFKKYATGEHSLHSLRKLLHNKGLRTKMGNPIAHSTMHQILTNPFYYGKMKRNDMCKMGKHEKLITQKLFDTCQLVAKKNGNYATRNRKYKFLLRGFLVCGECDTQWTAQWRRNINSRKIDQIAYYRCQKKKPCRQAYIETGEMEKQVEDMLANIKFTKGFISKITIQVMRYLKRLDKDRNKLKMAMNNKKQALVIKRSRLEDNFMALNITLESFNRMQAKVDYEINELDKKLIIINQSHKLDFDLLKEVLMITRNIPQIYGEVPDHIKGKYLSFFFQKIIVKDKKIEKIIYAPLINELNLNKEVILSGNQLPG